MSRRPRTVWLLDSTDPSGASVMALRRMRLLRHHCASTALALSAGVAKVPAGSPFAAVLPAGGLAGEVRIARADLVVTTTERTLGSAAPRLTRGTRLIHFLHTPPELALASEPFLRRMPGITKLVVPATVDPEWFADAAGLQRHQVLAADDFTVPADTLPGTARANVVVAAGRLGEGSAVLDLAEAFRLALPALPGWQLRVIGWGPLLADLREFVDRHRLAPRLLVLGARHDLPAHYVDAGLVARVEPAEANGLSVLEGLAAGIPVLGSDAVPAVRRHVRHGENGWVIERTDPTAIAAALVELGEPGVRAGLAAGARSTRGVLVAPDVEQSLRDLLDAALDTERSTC